MNRDSVVAIGLLTQTHLDMLGSSLKQVFPIADDDRFEKLLRALDDIGNTDEATREG